MKNLISIEDLEPASIWRIFNICDTLSEEHKPLLGKNIILIFKKPSLRTRISFEVAINDLGGKAIFVTENEIGTSREEIKDIARVLSSYVDCIILRVFSHSELIAFSKYASVPIINALSDMEHPSQALSDLYTIWKNKGKVVGLNFSFIGDCGNNVAGSWILLAGMMGINITLAFPEGYSPKKKFLNKAKEYAKLSGAEIKTTHNPKEAVSNAEVIYTDRWISMGNEEEYEERLKAFKGFTINKKLLSYAKANYSIMHCMPIKRNEEIEDEIVSQENSLIFEASKNKCLVAKGILTFLIG